MNKNAILIELKEKQIELNKRINAIGSDFKKGRSQDFAEQATESENDQVLDGIRHEAKLELQQVNAAISRLENNNYGICSKCESEISRERLHALPYVQTCINCAQ